MLQPVSYKRYFWCNNCFLLLVYNIHLSLSTNLVDPPPMRTIYMKHPLYIVKFIYKMIFSQEGFELYSIFYMCNEI